MINEETKKKIMNMCQWEMARLIRFAPAGHPYFTDGETYRFFMKEFQEKGGMTPEISKEIGWEK
jgi:hypothetical protein